MSATRFAYDAVVEIDADGVLGDQRRVIEM
jgi:hypothetical protein